MNLRHLLLVVVAVPSLGCYRTAEGNKARMGGGTAEIEMTLKGAKSLKISYTVRDERKYLEITDERAVRDLTETLRVVEVERGTQVGLAPRCTIDFTLRNGKELKAMFVKKKLRLMRRNGCLVGASTACGRTPP